MPKADELWSYACDLLLFCTYVFKIEIHSFVLMNNHYHMIVRTPDANIDKFMFYFNRELSREIGRLNGSINHRFGSRYSASVISDVRYYHNAYKYVYRNPVEAGACQKVEDYKYSSLNFPLGNEIYRFPIFDSYFDSIIDTWPRLDWLNSTYAQQEFLQIKRALKKQHFTLSASPAAPEKKERER